MSAAMAGAYTSILTNETGGIEPHVRKFKMVAAQKDPELTP